MVVIYKCGISNLYIIAVTPLAGVWIEIRHKEEIYLLKSNRFISEYQSRLYVDDVAEALNADGSINTDALGEFISVAVEKNVMFSKTLKKRYPDMYKLVEEALSCEKK